MRKSSPDGRWVAYASTETGRHEVFVKAFNDSPNAIGAGGKWTISNDEGRVPRWRADGKELLYRSLTRETLMSVDISASLPLHAGAPKELFVIPSGAAGGAMATDAQRFLYAVPVEPKGPQSFTAVMNWASGLKR